MNENTNYRIPVTIILSLCLIIVGMARYGWSVKGFGRSLGGGIWNFAVGLLIGVIISGLFMFFYNIVKPNNTISFTVHDKINIGLLCGIFWSILT